MLTFFRILYALSFVWAFYVALTEDFVTGVVSLLAAWALLWVFMVVVDALRGLGRLLSRSNVNINVYQERYRHPDPTRPDWIYEDEHPLVVLNESQYRRVKK